MIAAARESVGRVAPTSNRPAPPLRTKSCEIRSSLYSDCLLRSQQATWYLTCQQATGQCRRRHQLQHPQQHQLLQKQSLRSCLSVPGQSPRRLWHNRDLCAGMVAAVPYRDSERPRREPPGRLQSGDHVVAVDCSADCSSAGRSDAVAECGSHTRPGS